MEYHKLGLGEELTTAAFTLIPMQLVLYFVTSKTLKRINVSSVGFLYHEPQKA